MIKPKLFVLDTNIIISAAINRQGIEYKIVEYCITRNIEALITEEILSEYEEVIARPKFARYGFPPHWFANFRDILTIVPKPRNGSYKSPDPGDQMFVDLAEAFSAVVITGNIAHFPHELISSGLIMKSRTFIDNFMPAIIEIDNSNKDKDLSKDSNLE